MQKQNRPDCLEIQNISDNKNYDRVFKPKVRECLLKMTKNHCSYCDEHVWESKKLEVEHFKPQATFPELKKEYSNLYLACNSCNKHKKQIYPEIEPIRPDDTNYEFSKFFYLEPDSGNIKVIGNNKNAKETLNFLNLNRTGLKQARFDFCNFFAQKGIRPDLSFRFIKL